MATIIIEGPATAYERTRQDNYTVDYHVDKDLVVEFEVDTPNPNFDAYLGEMLFEYYVPKPKIDGLEYEFDCRR